MADNGKKTPAKISKLVYPFQKKAEQGKADAKPTDVDDSQVYFDALSRASDGFYPIGANGQWHGGIHFDAQTKQVLSQDNGVRCIGDGEVIAYQVDSAYATTDYSTGKAKYSRGFVLVRHRLELPAAPKAATAPPATGANADTTPATGQAASQASSSNQQKQEEPSLLFYSVYLHLLDWEGYKALDAKKARPAFWGQATYTVGEKANDSDRRRNASIPEGGVGLNLRNAEGVAVGYAAKGAKLELGAENPKKKGYFAIKRVISGTTNPADVVSLYAFKDQLTPVSEPSKLDVVIIPDEPVKIKAGELIGYLGQYERYMDTNPLASSRPRELVQLDVFTAEDIKAFITKSRERAKQLDAKQKTLLKIDKGAKLALPSEPDQIITSGEGIAVTGQDAGGAWVQVKKGSLQTMDKSAGLSGFKETTMAYDGGQVLHRLLGADDNDSITYSQYKALNKQEQAKYGRRQVLVPTGNPVWVERAQLGNERVTSGHEVKAWSQFPLKVGQGDGPDVGFIRVATIKHLKKSVTEADGTRWWEVDVGTLDGSTRLGWAREKGHTKVELCSPWDWPGFEHVEADTTTPEKLYARHIVATKQARPDEQAALEAKAAEASGGPLFSRLCDVIDLDDDRMLTPDELRKALKQPWQAEAISRLIVHHISEWGTPPEQWEAIDNDIPASRKADWDKEKQRIQSLQWWGQVQGKHGFPSSALVYHFHPIGIISNFSSLSRHPIIINEGRSIELDFLEMYDGSTIDESDYEDAANKLGCEVAAIKAVAAAETGATGSYYAFKEWDTVPAILYERHYFHRLTSGAYSTTNPEISDPTNGGYGKYTAQYRKLLEAYNLDKSAALKSASWGKFQIMGNNHIAAGYSSVEDFVREISISEKNHLKAFVSFIQSDSTLSKAIVDKDWLSFARAYNGPAQKGYDTKMRDNYNELSK